MAVDEFIQYLLSAFGVVTSALANMTFTINQSTLSVMGLVQYSMLISCGLAWIRSMSKDGLFTFNKEGRDKLSAGSRRFKERAR